MRIYKIEVMVIDFDDVGMDVVRDTLENTTYPNRCISPRVKRIQTREVEWRDEHPLNNCKTENEEYYRLFGR